MSACLSASPSPGPIVPKVAIDMLVTALKDIAMITLHALRPVHVALTDAAAADVALLAVGRHFL